MRKGTIGEEETYRSSGEALKKIIASLVVDVGHEIRKCKKPLHATDETLVDMVVCRIEEGGGKCFSSYEKAQKYYEKVTREVLWECANAEEAKVIIDKLKSGDDKFAKKFFYGTGKEDCNINPLRSKILGKIQKKYGVELSDEYFSTIVYTYLWGDGSWKVLDSYGYKGSFFSWLEKVFGHEVTRALKELINPNSQRASSNTRIDKSIDPEVWDLAISEVMSSGLHKDLLIASLVEQKSETTMMNEFQMDQKTLAETLEKANNSLKERLTTCDNSYETIVLTGKSKVNIEVSYSYVEDFIAWKDDCDNYDCQVPVSLSSGFRQGWDEAKTNVSPLADVLGMNLTKEETKEIVEKFLYEFPKKLNWSEQDKLIWRLRFISNIPGEVVAERCGKDRDWLNTRYSRLNDKFKTAIRKWWAENTK